MEKSAEQERRDALQAKKEADLIYTKTLQLKAEKMREEQRKLKEFYVAQMVPASKLHLILIYLVIYNI